MQYLTLFMLSFLASTVVPMGSEWLLVKMIIEKNDPLISVLTATAGNYLGALTTYYIGVFGSPFIMEKILRINEKTLVKAKERYVKYGVWTLLLSWVPVIGDPLCLTGGIFGVKPLIFSVLVIVGKALRYMAVVYITLNVT